MRCVVCQEEAANSCAACKSVHYCSRDHQKLHWPVHKKSCRPYIIKEDDNGQLLLVASRELRRDTIILDESPLFIIQDLLDLAERQFDGVCVTCGMNAMWVTLKKCSLCNWPVCSTECEQHEIHKGYECSILASNKITMSSMDRSQWTKFLTFIRVFCTKKNKPQVWTDLLNLNNITDEAVLLRFEPFNLNNNLKSSIPHLNELPDDQLAEIQEDYKKIQYLSSTKSFHTLHEQITFNSDGLETLSSPFQPAHYLFKIASLLQHSCIPNCTWNISDLKIRIRTSVKVPKGQVLTMSFLPTMQYPEIRTREQIFFQHFGHICRCDACLNHQPNFLTAVRCSYCNRNVGQPDGYLFPVDPWDMSNTAPWRCDQCPRVTPKSAFCPTLQQIERSIRDNNLRMSRAAAAEGLDSETMSDFSRQLIHDLSRTMLHPSHNLMQGTAKMIVSNAQYVLYSDGELSLLEMLEVVRCCKLLMDSVDKYEPGLSRKRGNYARLSSFTTFRWINKLSEGDILSNLVYMTPEELEDTFHIIDSSLKFHVEALKYYSNFLQRRNGISVAVVIKKNLDQLKKAIGDSIIYKNIPGQTMA